MMWTIYFAVFFGATVIGEVPTGLENISSTYAVHHIIPTTNVHYNDVIMATMASQITILTVVYSTVYLDADQRKHQRSASLAFVWGVPRDRWIPRTKGQSRGNFFPFEDFFMSYTCWNLNAYITGGHCGWECNVKTTSIVQVQINGVFFYWIDCFIWK